MPTIAKLPSLSLRLTGSLLILAAACLVGFAADLPQLPLQTLPVIVLFLIRKNTLPRTERFVIYSVLLCLITVSLTAMAWPLQRGHLGILAFFLHPELYLAMLFMCAPLAGLFGARRLYISLAMAAAVLSLGYCGDITFSPAPLSRLPFDNQFWLENFRLIYPLCVLGFLLLALIALRLLTVQTTQETRRPPFWRVFGTNFLCLGTLLTVMGTVFLLLRPHYGNLIRLISFIMMLEPQQLAHLRPHHIPEAPIFTDEVNLNFPIPLGSFRNANRIVLRVSGPCSPERLRLNCFKEYYNGTWRPGTQTKSSLNYGDNEDSHAVISFERPLPPSDRPDTTWEIFRAGGLKATTLPVPQDFTGAALVASGLSITDDGIVMPDDWEMPAGYSASARPNQDAFSGPAPENVLGNPEYLQIPEQLRFRLWQCLHNIPGWKEAESDAVRISLLLAFFAENFTYSLQAPPVFPPPYHQPQQHIHEDPCLRFLNQTRTGHCELFAASLTLLLRRADIPARYVTGFLCTEQSPDEKYYIVRQGQAHAWVEAFDREKQVWVCLDPTPSGALENEQAGHWNFLRWQLDNLSFAFTKIRAAIHRGVLSEIFAAVFTAIFQLLISIPGLLFLAVMAVIAALWIRRRLRKKRMFRCHLTPNQQAWQKKYIIFCQKFAKKIGRNDIPYYFSATELLELLENSSELSSDELVQARTFLKNYQRERFGRQEPNA